MRAVIQRVNYSKVEVEGKVLGEIGEGLLILLGISSGDKKEDADYLADKIATLRIFRDENDKLNLSLLDIKGSVLVVSQFTLYGDCRKGRRPSFTSAASPQKAEELYKYFIEKLKTLEIPVEEGEFGAMMKVHLINDGPVTFILDSEKNF